MNLATRTKDSSDSRGGELLPTDIGLLERLRDLDDHKSWQEFSTIYWKPIYLAASKAGLSDQEAEEVVQETMICVARRMKTFRYEPEKCSFKGWLMHLTRQRIIDCHRRRRKQSERLETWHLDAESPAEEIADTAAEFAFEAMWTEEWRKNLLKAADQEVRRSVNPEHYVIYHLHCVKNMSAREICRLLRVSALKVYIVQHRVAQKVRREVQRLEKKHL